MKSFLRRALRLVLKHLTRAVLDKHQPQIIALVGGHETAIAREALYTVLHEHLPTRRNIEAPEAEFVIPLTIFGTNFYPQSVAEWLEVIVKTAIQLGTLKPHSNTLILEMTTKKEEILDYWLEITKPKVVVACGNYPPSKLIRKENTIHLRSVPDPKTLKESLVPYRELARKIGRSFGLKDEDMSPALARLSLPLPRLRVLPGKRGNMVIDATYEYFPPQKEALEEVLQPLSGKKVWIRSKKDWREIKIRPQEVIVISGPRKDLLGVVQDATLNPLDT